MDEENEYSKEVKTYYSWNDRKFHSMFGFSKNVVHSVWNKFLSYSQQSFLQNHLFWFLYLLKNYDSDDVAAQQFRISRPTYEKWVWKVADELINLDLIKMRDRFVGQKKDCYLIVDTTECLYERDTFGNIQKLFYSGKSKSHSLKYEIGVQIETGNVCWVSGPYRGSSSDITISRQSGIFDQLLQDEWVLADTAYYGEQMFLHPIKNVRNMNDVSLKNFNIQLSSIRETVEHSIGRIKKMKFCTETFRHGWEKHQQCFFIACHLLNLELVDHPVHRSIY